MLNSAAKVITAILLFTVATQMCSGSSIPIWEFLTRNEKMSYLYSTFAQLVSVHCKATAATSAIPVNQCKRNLLAYGYDKLQTFTDAQLDAIDPYQRGASELIWSSIMRDHPSSTLITTRTPPLPTPPASSLIILTHQKPQAIATTAATNTDRSSDVYPKNPIFEQEQDHRHKYAMDMDIAYGYPSLTQHPVQIETFNQRPPQAYQGHSTAIFDDSQQPKTFLTGPLVFRVRPDGTPVDEDRYRPLPRDDDLEVFQTTVNNAAIASNSNGNNNGNINSNSNGETNININTGRPNKHRKIATISALKQQHLASLALQQQLLPPLEQPRVRRQYHTVSRPLQLTASSGYYYAKGQA